MSFFMYFTDVLEVHNYGGVLVYLTLQRPHGCLRTKFDNLIDFKEI